MALQSRDLIKDIPYSFNRPSPPFFLHHCILFFSLAIWYSIFLMDKRYFNLQYFTLKFVDLFKALALLLNDMMVLVKRTSANTGSVS
jgi:hypothetical protein